MKGYPKTPIIKEATGNVSSTPVKMAMIKNNIGEGKDIFENINWQYQESGIEVH
jgi:hypothetical protein